MSLYNAKRIEDAYRITKFTDDLEVEVGKDGKESSYITSRSTCDCPAGVRDTCRHRQMLPSFIHHERINTSWFFDWDLHRWFYHDPETGQMMNEPPRASWRRF